VYQCRVAPAAVARRGTMAFVTGLTCSCAVGASSVDGAPGRVPTSASAASGRRRQRLGVVADGRPRAGRDRGWSRGLHRPARPLRRLALRRRCADGHVRQGFTTSFRGTAATRSRRSAIGRELVAAPSDRTPDRAVAVIPRYLDEVERESLGPNVAFLVGPGRCGSRGRGSRPTPTSCGDGGGGRGGHRPGHRPGSSSTRAGVHAGPVEWPPW
jgi:hypothetical protein